MKLIALIRALCALIYWHLLLFKWKLPNIQRRHRRSGTYGGAGYLEDFTKAQTECASRLFWALCAAFKVKVEIDDGEVPRSALSGPLIVVSNHLSTLDILITYAVLERLGLWKLFWLLKLILKDTWYGDACEETHGALLGRNGTPGDMERVQRTGQAAQRYGATVVAYPEGERYTKERVRPDSGFDRLLPPHFGGYTILQTEMPKAHTLAITMHWDGGEDGFNIRTLPQIMGLFGRQLTIRVKLYPRTEMLDSNAQLLEIWHDMHAWLKDRAQEEVRQATQAAS